MARVPVLFVPGLCGSFNLGVLLDWRGPTLSGWSFPPFVDYGKNFVDSFVRAGYTRDRDLFVAFYDWRKSVQDSAAVYLKPWIDRAKQRSGERKVVLVTHSMGGLVARSYIQSRSYERDVAELITIGTPHRGSSEAYYPYGGGEIRADPTVRTVLNVYLWYLRHAHPFQTELDPLKTIRELVPGVRDLLPIDDYLVDQGPPPAPKLEDEMIIRNLTGDILNQPAGIEHLVERVAVATIASVGFTTIRGITVDDPPLPPGEPPVFPDGKPVSDIVDADGDGTVAEANARVNHPQAQNTPPLPGVSHGNLPDSPAVLARVFGQIGVVSPVLGEPPLPEPRLVVMTASPVTMRVETPGGPPLPPRGVLGAAVEEAAPRRPRVVRGKNHGHRGKHLNIAIIPRPVAGTYRVQLTGTATGGFALGAMLVSPEGVIILGRGEGVAAAPEPRPTMITTREGRVAAGAELFYQVTVHSLDAAPEVAIDAPRTTAAALDHLRQAMGAGRGVLGAGAEGADPVGAVLGGAADPLTRVDDLCRMAEQAVGAEDPDLAVAIIAELRAAQGGV